MKCPNFNVKWFKKNRMLKKWSKENKVWFSSIKKISSIYIYQKS